MTVAHNLDPNMVVCLVEQTELLVSIDLNKEADQRRQHNSDENAQGLKKDTGAHVQPDVFIDSHTHR